MSIKDLEAEFNILKSEVVELKTKINTLVGKYSTLEKKYEKSKKNKASFKCKECDEKLLSLNELKKHKEEHISCRGTFQCVECDKCFKEECKLNEHVDRIHTKYPCDDCDKIFKFEGLLEKHIAVAHEDIELFCHYYNNDKECPFDDQCIFVHEESKDCKFGKACERILCMFKHEENVDDADNEEEDDTESENEDSDDDDETEEMLERLKPSLENVTNAIEQVAKMLMKVSNSLKCDKYDFEAKNENGLTMHKKAKHANKS